MIFCQFKQNLTNPPDINSSPLLMINREESSQKVPVIAEIQLPEFIFHTDTCRKSFSVPNILSLFSILQA